MTRTTTRFALVATLLLALTPALAGPREEQARNLEKAGEALFLAGKYREALEQFQDVVQRFDGPSDVLNTARWNIARCYEEMGDVEAAMHAFEEFARWATKPEERQDAAAKIEALRPRLQATVKLSVWPDGARVMVDGARVEAGASPLVLAPGTHRLSVSAAGFRTHEEVLVLRAQETREVSISLKPAEGEVEVTNIGADVGGVVITVDDVEVYRGRLPALVRVAAGERKVRVSGPAVAEVAERVVTVPDGVKVPVVLALKAVGQAAPRPQPLPTIAEPAVPQKPVAARPEGRALGGQVALTVGEGFVHDQGKTGRTHVNLEALAGMRLRFVQPEVALAASVESPVMVLLRPGVRMYVKDVPVFFRLAGQVMLAPSRIGGLLLGAGGEVPLGHGVSLPLGVDVNLWPSEIGFVPVEFRLGVAYAF